MDITPLVPEGRQLIQSYGQGRFRVGGESYEGSVLIFPERTIFWAVTDIAEITIDSLSAVTAPDVAADILLIGCGPRFLPPPHGLARDLKAAGLALEWMDTGAACRTFNVLLAEERAMAAALVAVE